MGKSQTAKAFCRRRCAGIRCRCRHS
jgi:hypothetical protein